MTTPLDPDARERIKERREQFLSRIRGGVAIFPAAPSAIRNSDVEHEYRQDTDFYYLTGFEEPGAVAVLVPDQAEHRFVLFVQPKDREREVWTPILMLTAKDGEYDVAEALDTGADDFLSKPFSYVVLVARLRALVRRGGAPRPAVLRVDDLELDPATRRCRRAGQDVALTPREFALLDALMRRRGEVVPKQRILDVVWGLDFQGDPNVVEVYVRYLRQKIDAPFALAVLSGSGRDGKAPPPLPSTIGVLDYRIGEVAGLVWPNTLVDRAEPAVLAVIATAPTVDPGLRVVAAERAARLALVPPGVLAEQYRALPVAPEDVANGLATRQTGAMRRAVLMAPGRG